MVRQNNISPLFDLPFVLSIGPQRCGTQALEVYLRTRGDIALPAEVKETFYFDRHFQRGPGFYAAHFHIQPQHKVVMELATTAFDNPEAPARARDLLGGDIRLLCPLRHPVMRSYRVYHDFRRYGIVTGGLDEAVQQAPQILFASRYAEHLGRWLEVFGRDALTLVIAEDVEVAPEHSLQTMCRSMGWDFTPPTSAFLKLLKAGEERPGMLALVEEWLRGKDSQVYQRRAQRKADLAWLKERLAPEVARVEALLGVTLPAWHDGP